MRQIFATAFMLSVLAGCAATRQQVAENLGQRFMGQNADALVTEFGPPASTFRMNSGETAYVWQLSAVTSFVYGEGQGAAATSYCRVKVIASPAGIVTALTTEDASGTGGILGLAGIDVRGSICARRLGMPRRS
jgi:hypothetical protein